MKIVKIVTSALLGTLILASSTFAADTNSGVVTNDGSIKVETKDSQTKVAPVKKVIVKKVAKKAMKKLTKKSSKKALKKELSSSGTTMNK